MKRLATAIVVALSATSASANEFEPKIRQYLSDQIMGWAADQILVDAVLAQNASSANLTEDQIIDLDNVWRAEVGTSNTPTISSVLESSASDFLREQVEASGGAILEAFVMDMNGLNVATSGVTSDYWQGDESKFQKTYLVGADAVFVDDVEFDESTQSYLAQVSITLVDPATGSAIGAMTIGLNAEALF